MNIWRKHSAGYFNVSAITRKTAIANQIVYQKILSTCYVTKATFQNKNGGWKKNQNNSKFLSEKRRNIFVTVGLLKTRISHMSIIENGMLTCRYMYLCMSLWEYMQRLFFNCTYIFRKSNNYQFSLGPTRFLRLSYLPWKKHNFYNITKYTICNKEIDHI